jgi:hypothetical protein
MLFFIDESGHDLKKTPFEVLTAVAIEEPQLWKLIIEICTAERAHFGFTLKGIGAELKGRKLLQVNNFKFASQEGPIPEAERLMLCHSFLEKGIKAKREGISPRYSRREFAAYGQAVLSFVTSVFDICRKHRLKVFASMVPATAPRPDKGDFLRKDYSFLFERMYYFLDDIAHVDEQGLIVFDEIEKAKAGILINQMEHYFTGTYTGRERSSRIIPQPFFVHSDLTTAIQVADLIAYSLNWGYRLAFMREPARHEMRKYGHLAASLQYVGVKEDELGLKVWPLYGIKYISDLRSKEEKIKEGNDGPC